MPESVAADVLWDDVDRAAVEERFRALVERDAGALARLAGSYARSAGDRDDLLQEIAMALWQALPRFRGECSERTFLFRIALNRSARSRTRARARDARLDILPADSERDRMDAMRDDAPSPAAAAEREEERTMAEKALSGLDPSHRAALYLRAAEGLSYPEIAAILGCPTGTVKSRIFFARLRVSEALGERAEVDRVRPSRSAPIHDAEGDER